MDLSRPRHVFASLRTLGTLAIAAAVSAACRTTADLPRPSTTPVALLKPLHDERWAESPIAVDRGRAPAPAASAALGDVLAAQRYAGGSVKDLLATASAGLIREGAGPLAAAARAAVELEVALAALERGRVPLAEHLLRPLVDARWRSIQTAALTALGVIALGDARYREAGRDWNDALNLDPSYAAARLNLGFMHLRFGAAAKARDVLLPIKDQWFAAYGLIVAGRRLGRREEVDALCTQVLQRRPAHAPALISCALHAVQARADYVRGDELLARAIAAAAGNVELSERAYYLRSRLADERRAQRAAPIARGESLRAAPPRG